MSNQEIYTIISIISAVGTMILTAVLAYATLKYVKLTGDLAKCSAISIEQASSTVERQCKDNEIKNTNYLILIDSELRLNYKIYINYIMVSQYKKEMKIGKIHDLSMIINQKKAVIDSVRDNMYSLVSSTSWEVLRVELGQFVNPELMVVLGEYYRGLENVKVSSTPFISEKSIQEFAIKQLERSHKCFSMIDQAVEIPIARDLTRVVNGCVIFFDVVDNTVKIADVQ